MRTLWARTGLVLLLASASLGFGCAAERDSIDRVQPNAFPKQFFVGEDIADPKDDPEFRTKSFVVGSAVSQSAYGIGEFSALDRIRWDITENLLLARRAYQESPGADNRGLSPDEPSTDPNAIRKPSGTVVAAFAIMKHFDKRRAYNAQTGEESNLIEENDVDRPWNQREYMRVDWSKNLVESTNDSTRFFRSAKVTPVEYSVTNPADDDAPHFENKTGYLDVTNKFTVEDDDVQFSWGAIKRCVLVSFFTGASSYDCNPQEATVRTSFARVNPDEDFERFEDNEAWKDIVGNTGGQGDGYNPWLGSARTTWDPQYGFTDAQTHRYKSIHNLWKKSHQATSCASNEDADKNGSADACENEVTGWAGHTGSQCDVPAGKCTIPIRDREMKTLAYVLNREAPEAFQDQVDQDGKFVRRGTLEEMGTSWNQLFSVAIAYRREVECRRTREGDRETCHAEYFESDRSPSGKVMVGAGGWLTDRVKAQDVDKNKPAFYVCHNPVRSYDPEEACGKPGDIVRLGDVRRNHLIYWPYESRARYGGVGWNPSDPTTGESFGATATVMGRSATRAAAHQRDIIQLAIGDTKIEEIIDGVPAERYARTLKDGTAAPEGFRVGKTPAELAARLAAIDTNHLRGSINVRVDRSATPFAAAMKDTLSKAKSTVDGPAFIAGIDKFDTLASRLKGSVEHADQFAGLLRGYEPARAEAARAWFEEDMAARGACFHEAANAGSGSLYLASLAPWFAKKYANLSPKERGDRIYDDLVRETVKGIGLHELGHSIGLRHNFASSWDAPNYNPQYWQLRTNEGKAWEACSSPRNASSEDSCLGPRYVDPMTPDELGTAVESRPGIDYFANTSTMEYQIERGGESVGLGTYDLHAMKVLYGRVIETLDDKVIPIAQQPDFGLKNYTQLQERDLVIQGSGYFTHYTTTARLLKVFDPARDCRPATDEEKAGAAWRVVHGKVCAPPPKDHWAFEDFKTDAHPSAGFDVVRWHAKATDGKDRVRWNYRWGEQYGAGGYMHTTMSDAGADVYELTQNLVRSFDLRYPWTYFRRGDREWNDQFLPQATSSQYFSRLRAYHWQVALGIARASDADLASDDGERPYVMAQADIFNFLQSAALTPEPGSYSNSALHTAPGGRSIFDLIENGGFNTGQTFTLGIGDARYIAIDFENDKGGSWDYQKYVHHAGYDTEKSLALMQLVDPRPTLFTVARENYLDSRNVMINFRSDLPDGTDRLLGGILSEDWEAIAPYVEAEGGSIRGLDVTPRLSTRPTQAKLVFPNIGYEQQLAMATYGAIFSRLSSDMTLVNKMRVWIDGDRAPTIPGTREVRFADPVSGYSYVASKYGADVVDGKSIDRGIASRMLARANDLLAEAYQVKRGGSGKPVLDDKGQPELVLDSGERPIVLSSDADFRLRHYVGLLDATRQIGRALDGPIEGPIGGSSGGDE